MRTPRPIAIVALAAFSALLACGSVTTSELLTDGGDAAAAGAGGTSSASGRGGSEASAGRGGGGADTAGAAGASAGGGTGGRSNLGVCNGLPQSDDRYANLHVCPAGAALISEGGGTLTDSMNRTLYPCASCTDTLCVICRNDADGGTVLHNVWCVGPAAAMASYGTCR